MPELELDTVFEAEERCPSDEDYSSQPPSASSQGLEEPQMQEKNVEVKKEPYLAPPDHQKFIVKAPQKTLKMVENKSISVAIWHPEQLLSEANPRESTSSGTSGSCGEEGCNVKGCHGYQQGRHGLIDTDEIISRSVYEV